MDMTFNLSAYFITVAILTIAWVLSFFIFIICSFMRGILWGILCLFTGYIGGLIAVLVPGDDRPVKSFLLSITLMILLIGAAGGGGYYFSAELKKYVLADNKLYIQENGELKELPAPKNKNEVIFQQMITEIIRQSGGRGLDPQFHGKDGKLNFAAIPASVFEVTAIMGTEGTQDFNVMFNNNPDYSLNVGESFRFNYQGRSVDIKLKEVTPHSVILVTDHGEIKVPRDKKENVTEGDPLTQTAESTTEAPTTPSPSQEGISASTFKITAMMGQEGTQDFNVMFNNNPAYSVDVGKSFSFDYHGKKVDVKLMEVTANHVILVADGQEIKINRVLQEEASEGGQVAQEGSAGGGGSTYQQGKWLTSYSLAQNYAKELNRPILIFFTGSDWCGYCIKLDKETFSQQRFKDYVKDNYILVKIDFPRGYKLSTSQTQANEALAQKFGVDGYPTVYLVSADGSKTSEKMGGYQGDNLAIYLKLLEEFKKTQPHE